MGRTQSLPCGTPHGGIFFRGLRSLLENLAKNSYYDDQDLRSRHIRGLSCRKTFIFCVILWRTPPQSLACGTPHGGQTGFFFRGLRSLLENLDKNINSDDQHLRSRDIRDLFCRKTFIFFVILRRTRPLPGGTRQGTDWYWFSRVKVIGQKPQHEYLLQPSGPSV